MDFFAVFKAHISFYTLIPKFIKKRKKALAKNNINHVGMYEGSIVYDYFIKKKHFFNELELFKINKY